MEQEREMTPNREVYELEKINGVRNRKMRRE